MHSNLGKALSTNEMMAKNSELQSADHGKYLDESMKNGMKTEKAAINESYNSTSTNK